MADRVKYFMLGLLFLVVAGVIAYDRWNSREGLPDEEVATYEKENSGKVFIAPNTDNGNEKEDAGNRGGNTIIIDEREPKPTPPNKDPVVPYFKPEPDPIKPKPVTSKQRVHVVRSGEALEKISRKYYPDKVYKGIDLIVKANGLRSANVISEGQKLIIPAMDSRGSSRPVVVKEEKPVKAKPGGAKPAKKPSSGVPSTYVVKSSDGDLYKICRKFYGRNGEGARVARIMAANNLISINVKAGTKLKLPPR